MLSPFFACVLSSAKIRSCLRMRLAPSISIVLAMSRSSETCLVLSSERCMARERSRANTTKGGLAGPMNTRELDFGNYRCPERKAVTPGIALRHPSSSIRWRLLKRRLNPSRLTHAGTQSRGSLTGLEVAVKKGRQLRFGERPHLLRMDLPTLVQNDRRNAADTVLPRRRGIGIDVELRHCQLALIGLGDLIQHRREHLARATPFGPEINQDRIAGFQNVLLECRVG